jgi:hypothetical protein
VLLNSIFSSLAHSTSGLICAQVLQERPLPGRHPRRSGRCGPGCLRPWQKDQRFRRAGRHHALYHVLWDHGHRTQLGCLAVSRPGTLFDARRDRQRRNRREPWVRCQYRAAAPGARAAAPGIHGQRRARLCLP